MDQNQPELSFEESLKQVMQTLPPVIRDYLTQGKYTVVSKNLMAKYGLRIDQGSVLEREIMLLLMGVETPSEFMEALAEEAKLDQKTVGGIVQDVNDQIFVPLREEEENGSVVEPVAPAARPQRPLAPHIAPLPPKTAMPSRSTGTLGDIVRSVTAQKMLEDHEEPHIELSQVPVPPVAQSVPLAPVNLPGAMPPQDISRTFIGQKPAIPAPVAPYSSDPYREPIDEK